jgi:hypothetical protein
MNDPTNKYIADFQRQIAELNAMKPSATGWVIKVGSLWIAFAYFTGRANDKPAATTAAAASRFATYGEAYRAAKMLQNGNGERGKVQTTLDAIEEQIAAIEAAVVFLKKTPSFN